MNIQCFKLIGKRLPEKLPLEDFWNREADETTDYWLNISEADSEDIEELMERLKVTPALAEQFVAVSHEPDVIDVADGVLVRMPHIVSLEDPHTRYMTSLCLPGLIVTRGYGEFVNLEKPANGKSKGPWQRLTNIAEVLFGSIRKILHDDDHIIRDLRSRITEISTALENNPEDVNAADLMSVKNQINSLSTLIEDQSYCAENISVVRSPVFSSESIGENFKIVNRFLDHHLRKVVRMDIQVEDLHKHYSMNSQDKTNRKLNVLTIVQAVFVPLTLITGIYGMNFDNMPELHWQWGYYGALGVMTLTVLVSLWRLYRHGWFD